MAIKSQTYFLRDESATREFAQIVAERTLAWLSKHASSKAQPFIVYLEGHLGAGKTTFSQAFGAKLGVKVLMKSPTYTLVETYPLENVAAQLIHTDLYRLADPEELIYIGLNDLLTSGGICLCEWPERGEDILPDYDLRITLNLPGFDQKHPADARHDSIAEQTKRKDGPTALSPGRTATIQTGPRTIDSPLFFLLAAEALDANNSHD